MKLIEFPLTNGNTMLLNPDYITTLVSAQNDSCELRTTECTEGYYAIDLPMNAVAAILRKEVD